jgi:hypothetical protein
MLEKKKCILYGNCQVMIYAYEILKSIKNFTDEYELYPYVNHDRLNTVKLVNINIKILEDCDLFIYQPLNDNHGVYSTNYLLKFIKNNCIKISFPYIYNSALYTIHWENETINWRIGTLYNCGYKNIMIMIKNNISLDKILEKYDNNELDFYFEERMNICIESLKKKESECTIKVSQFILENHKDKRLFISQNHLTNYFFKWIVNEILKFSNKNYNINNNYAFDGQQENQNVNDKYNLNYYNFKNMDEIGNGDNCTKNKIKLFYEYFSKIKDKISIDDIKPYFIDKKEPEKFNSHDL